MKKEMFICLLIGLIIFCSCSQDRRIQVIPSEGLQKVIDSLVMLNNSKRKVFDLFVDQISLNECFMVLYMGNNPFYKNTKYNTLSYTEDVLSTYYFLSNGHEIRIYSGIESCFNLPEKEEPVGFEKIGLSTQILLSTWKDQQDLLWLIHLYNNEVISIHSMTGVRPFFSPSGLPRKSIIYKTGEES